jgi:hypothetical protein
MTCESGTSVLSASRIVTVCGLGKKNNNPLKFSPSDLLSSLLSWWPSPLPFSSFLVEDVASCSALQHNKQNKQRDITTKLGLGGLSFF